MRRLSSLSTAVALLLLAFVGAAFAAKIKHIVVLMEENRSFDHMLGQYNGTTRGTRGRDLYNDVVLKDGTKVRVPYTHNAPYINECDPNHNFPPTTYKIFGTEHPTPADNETMMHFAQFEYNVTTHEHLNKDECNVMQGFTPERLPVITSLAENFVLFDNFFCSVPGPTWPNRMFFMAGTSDGLTETGPWYKDIVGQLFPGRTIFDQVQEAGGTWSVYYDDTPWELFVETLAHHPENMRNMERFYADAAAGTLPTFSFINPRAGVNLTLGVGSNDQHPDHDVAFGEEHYRNVYQALRRSPAWNDTLFVLTYDEHGGFFDHVPPPRHVPSPSEGKHESFPDKFDFKRGGMRIPTILISPWLPKGMVVTDPPKAQMPQPTSVYELTSIIASSRKLLSVLNATPALTERDAWAATFEHLFDLLDAPRTDCPEELPRAPLSQSQTELRAQLEAEARLPINPLQEHIMAVHANLAGVPYPDHIQQQGHVDAWNQHHFGLHRDRTLAWKDSKRHVSAAQRRFKGPSAAATTISGQTRGTVRLDAAGDDTKKKDHFLVVMQPVVLDAVTRSWYMHYNYSVSQRLIVSTNATHDEEWCLDSANGNEGDIVGVSKCYPSADPVLNRDKAQQWERFGDASLRPVSNTSLCITTFVLTELGGEQLALEPCVDSVNQHFSWQDGGAVQPHTAFGVMFFGDDIFNFAVVRGS